MEELEKQGEGPYYDDPIIHTQIDELLHEAAILDAQIGKDNKDSADGIEFKNKIKDLYAKIQPLDQEFYEKICPKND